MNKIVNLILKRAWENIKIITMLKDKNKNACKTWKNPKP